MQKALQYLKRQTLVPDLRIRKSQYCQTVVFGFTYH